MSTCNWLIIFDAWWELQTSPSGRLLFLWQLIVSLQQYAGCHVLIKGPSRPFWLCKLSLYHRIVTCKLTANAHTASQLKIEGNKLCCCTFTYWLLVFLEGVILNKLIFSYNTDIVEMSLVPKKVSNKPALAKLSA